MRHSLISLVTISTLTLSSAVHAAQPVAWASADGMARLERSNAKVDFFPLANHFESQENKLFCGLASSAIVLNTLRLDNPKAAKPQDNALLSYEDRSTLPKGFDPIFLRYTQHTLLGSHTKSKAEILGKPITLKGKPLSDYGLQLKQLANVLSENGLNVTVRVANAAWGDDVIRKELIANMQSTGDYVLVNYSRKTLGQGDGGHISPLGAYDEQSDSFLILDVNPNTSGWVWVTTADLIAAMRTFDTLDNRGYLLIREGNPTKMARESNRSSRVIIRANMPKR